MDINSEFFKDFSETWHRGVMVSTTSQHQLTRTELGFSAGSNNAYVMSGFAIVSFWSNEYSKHSRCNFIGQQF